MTIRFTILGEPASKANSREIVTFPMKCTKCPSCAAPAKLTDKMCRKCDAPFVRPAVIKSKKARDYEEDALRQLTGNLRVMMTGPVRVTLRIYYASERPDLDESVILDVLQARFAKRVEGQPRQVERTGVYLNDRQVREKHVYHDIDRDNPRAEIEVEQLQPEASLFDQLPIPVAARPRKKQRAEPPRKPIAELAPGEVPF
jgi:hypothetical protein